MINYNDYFSGYDNSFEFVYHSSWSSYEEHGWIFIFEKNKKYYSIEGGYCVFQEFAENYNWNKDLMQITADESLNLMIEWDKNEQ